MLSTTTIFACLAVAASVASGSMWRLPAFPDEDPIMLNGTTEAEVHRELLTINPNYDTDFPNGVRGDNGGAGRRRDWNFAASGLICSTSKDPKFGFITKDGIENAIQALEGVQGIIPLNKGPKVCSELACDADTRAFICNDNNSEFHVGSYENIIDAVRWIREKCAPNKDSKDRPRGGQVFTSQKWNVILEGTSC
ncbi:hypothetical protein JDV02_007109 [Purpureocillium takamizusanense]|uniref:Uncharacterized protein n=1 Tax=Purpureocillium takamizusanense TaxID=2060973 RepID=A0A9Q8QK45_9HYPO|nr:uncharacterized protein JDV02_007109 [Purpureocillium takamizusanense]UNI21090.1 hypothetical protein JDV02_007109 [Purpureocillium takamizusanense]